MGHKGGGGGLSEAALRQRRCRERRKEDAEAHQVFKSKDAARKRAKRAEMSMARQAVRNQMLADKYARVYEAACRRKNVLEAEGRMWREEEERRAKASADAAAEAERLKAENRRRSHEAWLAEQQQKKIARIAWREKLRRMFQNTKAQGVAAQANNGGDVGYSAPRFGGGLTAECVRELLCNHVEQPEGAAERESRMQEEALARTEQWVDAQTGFGVARARKRTVRDCGAHKNAIRHAKPKQTGILEGAGANAQPVRLRSWPAGVPRSLVRRDVRGGMKNSLRLCLMKPPRGERVAADPQQAPPSRERTQSHSPRSDPDSNTGRSGH